MPECPVLTRYTASPTKFDIAPYGTLCKVIKNDEATEVEYFIQTSSTGEDPAWLAAPDLLFYVYKQYLEEPVFVESLLQSKKEIDERSKTVHMQ